jgi:hypothetical protein
MDQLTTGLFVFITHGRADVGCLSDGGGGKLVYFIGFS